MPVLLRQKYMEIWGEGDAWYHFRQVVCELFAITRSVQDTVNVVEDVIFGDGFVAIVLSRKVRSAVSEMLSIRSGGSSIPSKVPVAFGVSGGLWILVARKALTIKHQLKLHTCRICHKYGKRFFQPFAWDAYYTVFAEMVRENPIYLILSLCENV